MADRRSINRLHLFLKKMQCRKIFGSTYHYRAAVNHLVKKVTMQQLDNVVRLRQKPLNATKDHFKRLAIKGRFVILNFLLIPSAMSGSTARNVYLRKINCGVFLNKGFESLRVLVLTKPGVLGF